MPRVVRTRLAYTDILEIALHVRRDNPKAADQLLDTFEAKLRVLARVPGMGASRAWIGRDVRSFPVGQYVLFYRPRSDGIQLLRVVHGKRDLQRIFRRRK